MLLNTVWGTEFLHAGSVDTGVMLWPALRRIIWSFWHRSMNPEMRLANSTTYWMALVMWMAHCCHITSADWKRKQRGFWELHHTHTHSCPWLIVDSLDGKDCLVVWPDFSWGHLGLQDVWPLPLSFKDLKTSLLRINYSESGRTSPFTLGNFFPGFHCWFSYKVKNRQHSSLSLYTRPCQAKLKWQKKKFFFCYQI